MIPVLKFPSMLFAEMELSNKRIPRNHARTTKRKPGFRRVVILIEEFVFRVRVFYKNQHPSTESPRFSEIYTFNFAKQVIPGNVDNKSHENAN